MQVNLYISGKLYFMKRFYLLLVLLFSFYSLSAQYFKNNKAIKSYDGFFNFYYDDSNGKLFLEVKKLDQEFLFVHAVASGLGSNDIGIDRGQLGDGVVVKFIKTGNKLLLLQPNQNYRANTTNALEKKSVEQAFAKSILFGFPIKESINNSYLIDITPFLLKDTHNIIQTLKKKKEGTYKLDESRSAIWLENTKAFPKNVEFESLLTFVGEPTGKYLKTVAPDAQSISVVQHYSFVALPEKGYKSRDFDPRCGSWPLVYKDYATPVWESIDKRLIYRHRLEKKQPDKTISDPVKPIIYYLDPGVPEPIRSALLEGASWWNQAFEQIGYRNAFQVKILPPDADPMDVRYNVIQWVHRSTRGWSYGGSISDPRTGEIIKGHVSLGSLRIRQDFLIAQALLNKPFYKNDENYNAMLEMALARIRQLAAHEVGHTLGFSHNFTGSAFGRESVMDYPHPLVTLKRNKINLSQAYDTGIGAWDKVTVAYAYGDIPKGKNEKEFLNALLDKAFSQGMMYITDSDARAKGGAHPYAHLWDNGKNVSEELIRLLAIRKIAIQNFSEHNIKSNEPYAVLEDVFVPLYFFHRYQTEAVAKLIGGLDYSYAIKGGNQKIVQPLDAKSQNEALQAILQTLQVSQLAIPDDKLKLFPPRAYGYPRTRESFKSTMGVAFDAIGVPTSAAQMTIDLILHPQRLNRLTQQKAFDSNLLGTQAVLDALIETIFNQKTNSKYEKEIQNACKDILLQTLFKLYNSEAVLPQVKANILNTIDKVLVELKRDKNLYNNYLINKIYLFKTRPKEFPTFKVNPIPDGSPIGSFQCLNY